MLVEIMANPDSEIRQQLASVLSSQQVPTMQPPQMITHTPQMQMVIMQPTDSLIVPSSIGSTANREHYAVDDIVAPIACSLVISYGITNVRTTEVATGMVIPGRDYHNKKMQEEYCRVEVLTVIEGHRDDFLDIPTPDGVEKLGQAINEFIL